MSRLKEKITIEDLSEDLIKRKEYFKIDKKYPNEMGEMLEFFLDLLILRGRSLNTTKSYYNDLCSFYDYMKEFYPNIKSLLEIDRVHLNKFFMYCQSKKGNSSVTLARKEKTVALFFRVLVEQGLLETGAAPLPNHDSLKRRNTQKKRLQIYAEKEEIKALFNEILKEKSEFIRYRDYCMFGVLLITGLRVSELTSLNTKDIEHARKYGYMFIIGKGNKERPVEIEYDSFKSGFLKYIDNYLEAKDNYFKETGIKYDQEALFLGREGNRISTAGTRYRLKAYVTNAGINKNLTPHKLRHTFATLFMMATNNDIKALQYALGHEDPSTSLQYSKLVKSQQRNNIKAFTEYVME